MARLETQISEMRQFSDDDQALATMADHLRWMASKLKNIGIVSEGELQSLESIYPWCSDRTMEYAGIENNHRICKCSVCGRTV